MPGCSGAQQGGLQRLRNDCSRDWLSAGAPGSVQALPAPQPCRHSLHPKPAPELDECKVALRCDLAGDDGSLARILADAQCHQRLQRGGGTGGIRDSGIVRLLSRCRQHYGRQRSTKPAACPAVSEAGARQGERGTAGRTHGQQERSCQQGEHTGKKSAAASGEHTLANKGAAASGEHTLANKGGAVCSPPGSGRWSA